MALKRVNQESIDKLLKGNFQELKLVKQLQKESFQLLEVVNRNMSLLKVREDQGSNNSRHFPQVIIVAAEVKFKWVVLGDIPWAINNMVTGSSFARGFKLVKQRLKESKQAYQAKQSK